MARNESTIYTNQIYCFLLRFKLKLSLVLLSSSSAGCLPLSITYTLQGLSGSSRQWERERVSNLICEKIYQLFWWKYNTTGLFIHRKCCTKEKDDQKAVDGVMIAIVVVSELKTCLGTRSSLHKERSGMSFFLTSLHELVFYFNNFLCALTCYFFFFVLVHLPGTYFGLYILYIMFSPLV